MIELILALIINSSEEMDPHADVDNAGDIYCAMLLDDYYYAELEDLVRILLSVPLWLAFIVFRTALILLGWVVVPTAVILEAYDVTFDQKKSDKGEDPYVYHFTSKLMYLWDNDEDGIANTTYYTAPTIGLQIIYWSCIRNPANNLRYVPFFGARLDKNKIKYIGTFGESAAAAKLYNEKTSLWFYAWCGIYSNILILFRFRKSLYKFRIGWKIWPDYIGGIPEVRLPRSGFAIQLKKVS